MHKLPSPTWVLAALATLGAPAMAATTARSAPGDPSERVAIHRASPTLSNAEVTEVDEEARTFTVAVVFSDAASSELPAVGAVVDVTYGGVPGALRATTVKSSKSNSSDRVASDEGSPRLKRVEVSGVDRRSKSFTVAVVFSAADLEKLPAVGTYIDVTYVEAPGGGPLGASNLDLSKSNVN